jgi:hypothetical protein
MSEVARRLRASEASAFRRNLHAVQTTQISATRPLPHRIKHISDQDNTNRHGSEKYSEEFHCHDFF